jgi:pilus assembly protein Flp/PilA
MAKMGQRRGPAPFNTNNLKRWRIDMLMMKAISMMKTFRKEEDGLALTEYLILLGLLVGGVILSVLTIGGELTTAWGDWATFFEAQNFSPAEE